MKEKCIEIKDAEIIILGITYKENCPDTRNSKVLNLYNYFSKKNFSISTYDPYSKFWSKKFIRKYNTVWVSLPL